MENKTNLFTNGSTDITSKHRDNVFMNQSGGESVRTAILINPNQVLEFYTDPETKKVVVAITPVADYIFEEFIAYRHDMDRVYHVLDKGKLIIPYHIENVEVLESTDDYAKAVLATGNMVKEIRVELKHDEVYLDEREM